MDSVNNVTDGKQGDIMHMDFSPQAPAADETDFGTFLKVDIRVGTILRAEAFPEARKPAYKLWIDFGPAIGEKKTSAQITENYELDALIGTKVAGVVNFPVRQIGPFRSEVLTLGFADEKGHIVLIRPDETVPNGARLA